MEEEEDEEEERVTWDENFINRTHFNHDRGQRTAALVRFTASSVRRIKEEINKMRASVTNSAETDPHPLHTLHDHLHTCKNTHLETWSTWWPARSRTITPSMAAILTRDADVACSARETLPSGCFFRQMSCDQR